MKGYKHKSKKNNNPSKAAPPVIYKGVTLFDIVGNLNDAPALSTACASSVLSSRHYYLNDGQELKGVLSLPCIKSTSKCR